MALIVIESLRSAAEDEQPTKTCQARATIMAISAAANPYNPFPLIGKLLDKSIDRFLE